MMKLISHDNMRLKAGRAFLFLCLVVLAAKASAESITLQEWEDWRKDDKVIARIDGRFDLVITGVKNLKLVGKREGEGRLKTHFDSDYPGEYYTSHEINRYYEATVPKNSTVNIDVKVTHSGDIGKSEVDHHHLTIYDERGHFQESNKNIKVPGTPTNISASTSYHLTRCDDYNIEIASYEDGEVGEVGTGIHIHHPFQAPSFHVYIKLHVTNEEPLAEEPPQTIEEASTGPHVVEVLQPAVLH